MVGEKIVEVPVKGKSNCVFVAVANKTYYFYYFLTRLKCIIFHGFKSIVGRQLWWNDRRFIVRNFKPILNFFSFH